MTARFLFITAAALLVGTGCDQNAQISLRWPFALSPPAAEDIGASALAVTSGPGTVLTIQPSFLGVTGTVADLIGSKEGAKTAAVSAFEPGVRARIEWTDAGDPGKKGSVDTAGWTEAHEMFLPAFWPAGDGTTAASPLWLSPAAWRGLKEAGSTEWKLGLAGEDSVDAALKTLQVFQDLAAKLSGGGVASATSSSPFRIVAGKKPLAFPLRIDGKLAHVRALTASSWFADYVILENPANPLILKVTVNPVALSALDALKPLGVDVRALGYEITSIDTPK